MQCKEISKGKWECVADGPRDPVTGQRKQIRRRASTKKEAKRKVEDAVRTIAEDGINLGAAKKTTFEQLAWEWLDVYALKGVKDSTVRNRRSSIKILLRYIASIGIADVDTRRLQRILNDLFEKEYSRTAMENVKVTAKAIFDYAKTHRMIKDNPVPPVIVPRKRLTVEELENPQTEEKFFERHELMTFLDAVDREGLQFDREWFYLLAFTGMRVGELCALRWDDLDFETNRIRITKTMDMPNHNMRQFQVTPPKSKAAVRLIDVDEEIMKMMKAHKARQAKVKLQVQKHIEDYHDGRFVFCRPNGYPYASRFIYDRIIRIINKAGLTKLEGPHILRHTHITMLTEAGVDLRTIMDRVGHDDSKTTIEIYTHVTERMKEDAATKLKVSFGDILQGVNSGRNVTGM